jgi:hypothetical protein
MLILVRHPLLAIPFLTLAVISGCSSWRTIHEESPEAYIDRAKPSRVRVSVAESTIVLTRPSVLGDSVVGAPKGSAVRARVAIAASEIRKVEGPTSGPGFIAFGAVTLAAALIYFLSYFGAAAD